MFAGRLMALFLGISCALLAQPALTTIQDTLFKADGTRFNGSAAITWQTFDAADTSVIGQQSRTVNIVNGALFVQLVPNTTATPVSNYTVRYNSDGKEQFREIWAVTVSTRPLRIRDVRVTVGLSSGGTGVTPGGQTPIQEADIVGLIGDLALRPVKGPGYGPGRSALINGNGEMEAVAGNSDDCVRVDGSSGPCFDASVLANFVDDETPVGIVDAVNDTFTLANIPAPPSSLQLYRNGVFQNPGLDYVLTSAALQFQIGALPQPGDTLLASYRVGGGGAGSTRTINTAFPLTGGGSLQSDLNLALADAAFLRRGHKTMVIGDSQAGGANPDQPFPDITPLWFSQAVVASRSSIRYMGNAGVVANSTQNMLDRLQTDVLALKPDKVFIVAGYSDITSLMPVSTIVGNITSIINQMKAANILPILCTLPPKPPIDSTGAANPAVAQEIIAFNLQLRKLADQQGLTLIDFYSILVDPVTGRYKAGYSADSNNPQMPATKLMAQAAIDATRRIYDPTYPWLPSTDGDGINLMRDPLFLQTPALWTPAIVSGTVAMQTTVGTDPAISGNTMTLTKTDPPSVNTLTGGTVNAGFSPGDRLAIVGRLKSANCEAGQMTFDIGLNFNNPAGRQSTHPIFHWNADVADGQFYVEFTAPVGATQFTPVIQLNAGTGSVTVGQLGVLNLTLLGL